MKYQIAKPRLPAEYQEVEWIESSETQYIDMVIKPKTTLLLELDYKIIALTSDDNICLFGSKVGADGFFSGVAGNYKYYINNTSTTTYPLLFSLNQRYKETYSNGLVARGGSSYSTPPIVACDYNMYLFARNDSWTPERIGTLDIYSCKIWDSSTLIRNFIPCYRKSDGVIGLYDLCGSICPLTSTPFYINSGTGAFTKGANKTELVKCDIATYDAQNNVIERCNIWHDLPREFQRVEYIESHGTEYVDTGIKMQSGYKWEVEMAFTGFTNTFQQIGAIQQVGPDYRRTHCGYAKVDAYDNLIYYPNSESENAVMIAKDTSFHKFATEISSGYFKISIDNVTANKTFFAYPNLSLYLFARNFGGSPTSWCTCRIKSSIITNGNSVIQNLVPCYRKSDNVIGLYDTINDKFYTNQGTGTFGKGADVN